MEHLTTSRLADFVRDLLTEKERANAEEHLSACPDCRASVLFFVRVQEAASGVAVPEEVVRAAKALFVQPALKWPGMLRRVVATLVPPVEPQWAEVRRVEPAPPHVMYRWEDYCIDLRFEREMDRATLSLLGQIANERTPERPVGDVPVLFLGGDRVIAETRCNELGEFALEIVPVRGMRVRFDVKQAEVSIDVPLNKVKIEKL